MIFFSTFGTGFDGNVHRFPRLENAIFHVFDVFDYQFVQQVINTNGLPKLIISDHILDIDIKQKFNIDFCGLPLWLDREIKLWKKSEFDNTNMTTDFCFNFMINKKQTSRYLLIKFVEIFNLENYTYSWSGLGRSFDCSMTIQELNNMHSELLTNNQRSKLLAPITIPEKFVSHQSEYLQVEVDYGRINYGGNRWAWDNAVQELFNKSAVSLISETVNYQLASVFTEKTMFSVIGLTFPIWIGGYGQASQWKQIGFDIFEDIINHNYQFKPTLVERCYWAFKDNLPILTDLNLAASLRKKHHLRLLKNRELLLDGALQDYTNQIIKSYSGEELVSITKVIDMFKNSTSNMSV
jgi:hypothetical protein